MWLFTTFGFFSAVQKPGDDFLTIRGRSAKDLDRLREKYLPASALPRWAAAPTIRAGRARPTRTWRRLWAPSFEM